MVSVKSPSIKEGDQSRIIQGVSKIRTNLSDGTTQNWIPEEDAGLYAHLNVKNVYESGVYVAQRDGLDGYSVVNVSVTKIDGIDTVSGTDPIQISQGDNGQLYVTPIDPQTGLPVPGAEPVKLEDYYSGDYRPGDSTGGTPIDPYNQYYGQGTTTGLAPGSGTSVDPTTGEETPVFDENMPQSTSTDPTTGQTVVKPIPARIVVITPPNKTTYTAGETIDYTGLQVGVYKSATSFVPFPLDNGLGSLHNIIPFNELSLPATRAPVDPQEEDYGRFEGGTMFVSGGETYIMNPNYNLEYTDGYVWIHGQAQTPYSFDEAITRGLICKASDIPQG